MFKVLLFPEFCTRTSSKMGRKASKLLVGATTLSSCAWFDKPQGTALALNRVLLNKTTVALESDVPPCLGRYHGLLIRPRTLSSSSSNLDESFCDHGDFLVVLEPPDFLRV